MIRERARQEYLKMREEQQMILLERKIRDEEELFASEQLTEEERARLEYDKQVLRLARERMDINQRAEGYSMPEDYLTEKGKIDRKKKEAVLYKRYEDEQQHYKHFQVGASGKIVTEQEQWEETQLRLMQQKVGVQERLERKREEDAEEFQYLFDDTQIDFVLQSTLHQQRDKDAILSQVTEMERKAMSITQVRRSLPVYLFREQLLQAIEQFQVLVIVGEDGQWQDDANHTIPARGRLHQGRQKGGMHTAPPCSRHECRGARSRRDGRQAGIRGGVRHPLRRLHKRQDSHQVHDGRHAAARVPH